ncbi:MAG: SUMF1/EgtB/PvdO family nonheme iron enzyme [Kiritimatiellae bacterium]|nr:SUMF1/EgtB/PvdO family nonheme iron enzyme [Kiritimatiellia bacterium]
MKSLCCLLILAITCGLSAFGGDEELITINSVVATPRYPWNGIWDIVVDISMPAEKSVGLEFEAKDSQTGKRLTCGAVQRSDGGPMLAAAGKTRFVWFTDRDLGPGITEHVSVGVTPVPYMIVDVGGGPDATGYPVSIQYLLDIPVSTGWTDEYKTTKIPMRWIRPEIYNRPGYTNDFPQVHENYWIAVFETTQRQYEMVTGLKPANYQGSMRPVESLSVAAVTNYITLLKNKTGRKFNLPNNDRWQYACRAGTVSLCYDGTSNCVRKVAFAGSGSSVALGRYADNCGDGKGGYAEHTAVGSYVPNAFGLYDCLGNVKEFNGFLKKPYFGTNTIHWASDYVNEKFVYYKGGDWEKGEYYPNTSSLYRESGYKFVGAGKGEYVILSEHFYTCLGGDYSMITTNIVSESISLEPIKSGGFGGYSTDYKYYHSSFPLEYGFGYYYESGVRYSLPKLSELKLDAATGFRIGCDAE